MKTLPNGVTIYNATPHNITFWTEGWSSPIEVEPDEVISAEAEEKITHTGAVQYVETKFTPSSDGKRIVERVSREHPNAIIVGSMIAAQAYPGDVAGMTPAPGYERVPPHEKRMNPDKFNMCQKHIELSQENIDAAKSFAYGPFWESSTAEGQAESMVEELERILKS